MEQQGPQQTKNLPEQKQHEEQQQHPQQQQPVQQQHLNLPPELRPSTKLARTPPQQRTSLRTKIPSLKKRNHDESR